MNSNGVVTSAAATFAAALLVAGCSSTPPVGPPYAFRVAGYQGTARIHSGSSMAQDGRQETPTHGDQMDFDKDLGLTGSVGQRGVVEARLSPDAEIRGTFDRYHEFGGATTLDRTRRFDGHTFDPGDYVHGSVDWNRATFSYAQRVGVFRGEGLPVDVLARVGAERDQFFTKVKGAGLVGDRFAIAGAPFAGLEARIGLADSLTLIPSVDAGGIQDGDKRITMGDAQIELRWNVWGPLDLSASYEFSGRHLTVQRSDDERSDVRSNVSMWLVGVGLRF